MRGSEAGNLVVAGVQGGPGVTQAGGQFQGCGGDRFGVKLVTQSSVWFMRNCLLRAV